MRLFGPKFVDGQIVDLAGLRLRLRVSDRARRISLRIDAAAGEAIAVAPSARHLDQAVDFARSRRDWLANRLARPPPAAITLQAGDQIRVFDQPWRLRPDGRRPRLIGAGDEPTVELIGCGLGGVDPQLVIRAIRREAADVFAARAVVHCASLGAAKPPIALIDARTRWGSCTPAQRGKPASVRLSWRLALAPFPVADYVVAHECAHLLEANHGPLFWAHVHTLVADVAAHRAWLRTHGASLHAILPKA